MAWGVFFQVVTVLYVVYFLLNILYDLFMAGKGKAAVGDGVLYDLAALIKNEETPQEVSHLEEAAWAEAPADLKDDGQESDWEEDQELGTEEDEGYDATSHTRYQDDPEPALKVVGQGIPLEVFLREAKSQSNSIF